MVTGGCLVHSNAIALAASIPAYRALRILTREFGMACSGAAENVGGQIACGEGQPAGARLRFGKALRAGAR
jgi:hypothetical protein